MSSLTRMLSILDVFSSTDTSLSAEAIAEKMKFTRTTCYRYVKELSLAGLLVSVNGVYTLGPRIINLDYKMRESDPLLSVGAELIKKLVDITGGNVLLSSLYDEQIINVHHETGGKDLHLGYSRGRAMPLFKGASSKVIVASMKRARLKRLFERRSGDADFQVFNGEWPNFWRYCQQIVQQGYWVSREELDSGHAGIAAPIPLPGASEVTTSLSLILRIEHFSLFDEAVLGRVVIDTANQIGARVAGA